MLLQGLFGTEEQKTEERNKTQKKRIGMRCENRGLKNTRIDHREEFGMQEYIPQELEKQKEQKKFSVKLTECVKEKYVWEYSRVMASVKQNCMTLIHGESRHACIHYWDLALR